MNASSTIEDDYEGTFKSHKTQTKEAQVSKLTIFLMIFNKVALQNRFWFFKPQEAEAFALYHKALDLQKHDRFEESAKAYHELLEIRLLREVSDL